MLSSPRFCHSRANGCFLHGNSLALAHLPLPTLRSVLATGTSIYNDPHVSLTPNVPLADAALAGTAGVPFADGRVRDVRVVYYPRLRPDLLARFRATEHTRYVALYA